MDSFDLFDAPTSCDLWAAPQFDFQVAEPLPSSTQQVLDDLAAEFPLAEFDFDFEVALAGFSAMPAAGTSQAGASTSAPHALLEEGPSSVGDHAPLLAPFYPAPLPATTMQHLPLLALPWDAAAAGPLFGQPTLTPADFDTDLAEPSPSAIAFVLLLQESQQSALGLDLGESSRPPSSPADTILPAHWLPPPAPEDSSLKPYQPAC